MRTAKRLMSLLLAVTLLSGMIVTGVYAANEYTEGYVASADGTYEGIPSVANVTYLNEDLCSGYYIYGSVTDTSFAKRRAPAWDSNFGKDFYVRSPVDGKIYGVRAGTKTGTDANGDYREIQGIKYYLTDMVMGAKGTVYKKGFGVVPSALDNPTSNYVMFDISGLGAEYFYAVTGITGTALNTATGNVNRNNDVVFEVYGSTKVIADTESASSAADASFTLLASSGDIKNYASGEFRVPVSGYKTLKLVVKLGSKGVQAGTNSAWANACVYSIPKVSVSASVVWNDNDNKYALRPDSVAMQLYANGTAQGSPVSLSASNSWATTWSNLPKYDDDLQPITYTVSTDAAPDHYTLQTSGNTYTYTCTYDPNAVFTEHTVTLNWNDSNDQLGKRPASVDVNIYADGSVCRTIAITAADNWTKKLSDLPKFAADGTTVITYTAKVSVEDYDAEVTNAAGSSTITLSCNPSSKFYASVNWVGDEAVAGNRPTNMFVQLYADGVAYGPVVELNDGNNWSYGWPNLPEIGADGVTPIHYSVKVVERNEYTTNVSGGTITQTYVQKINFQASVVWNDNNDKHGLRPETVLVVLRANGVVQSAAELSKENNWKCNWVNLEDKDGSGNKINYTVELAEPVDQYKSTVSDGVITATCAPSINYTVNINWNHGSNAAANRPSSVKVQMYIDGVPQSANVSVSADSNGMWTHTWPNLPKFADDGSTEIDYFVNGVTVPDYTMQISGNTITYTYEKFEAQNVASIGKTGSLNGTTEDPIDGTITYLSDLYGTSKQVDHFVVGDGGTLDSRDYKLDQNWDNCVYVHVPVEGKDPSRYKVPNQTGVDERTLSNGVTYHRSNIAVGAQGTIFQKGLSAIASPIGAPDSYVIYDLRGMNVDFFYAVAGVTGSANEKTISNKAIVFEVWGSTGNSANGTYEKLATSANIRSWLSAEFNVQITGYNFLKLVMRNASTALYDTNSGLSGAWGDACVFDADVYDPNAPLPGVYTPSTDGTYAGVTNAKNGKVTYLSNLKSKDSSNTTNTAYPKGQPTTINHPYNENNKNLVIGQKDAKFAYGLGMHPKDPKHPVSGSIESWTIYDVSSYNMDRFHAIVGLTNDKGKSGNSEGVIFRVYADYEGNGKYRLLAESEKITQKMSGQFDVDIAGAKTLKVVVVCAGNTHTSSAAAFANACIYQYDAKGSSVPIVRPNASSSSSGGGTAIPGNAFGGYTSVPDGTFPGVDQGVLKSVIYLSEQEHLGSSNTTNTEYPNGQPTTIDHPYNSKSELITLGEMDQVFFNGLGMHPKNPKQPVNGTIESWTIYDVSQLNADRFYAAVGITNTKGKDGASKGVVFRVYGDSEGNGSFKKLAESETITGRTAGEFDVDITGIKTLKLVVVCAGDAHTSSAAAFANACVYNSQYVDEGGNKPSVKPSVPVVTDPVTQDPTNTDNGSGFPVAVVLGVAGGLLGLLLLIALIVIIVVLAAKKKKKA